jgi:quinol monooxygenase YgiN
MIYVLSLYEVGTEQTTAFQSLYSSGGLWQSFANRLSGHIHTALMNDARRPGIFLILEFWTSESHYIAARKAPEVLAFELSVQTLTKSRRSLGVFAFRSAHN